MKNPAKLSDSALARIKAAVQKAEEKISGEIVPVLITRSHHYPSAKYKSALLFSFIAFLFIILGDRFIPNFGLYDPLYYFAMVYGSAAIGFILPVWFPSFAVGLATEKEKRHTTYQKAETIFLEQEVFNTKLRSGILLFISFDEREVVVIADSGINQKVDQHEWDVLVSNLIEKIKNKQVTEGLEEAILKCGEILLEKGFYKDTNDTNELPDHLISE